MRNLRTRHALVTGTHLSGSWDWGGGMDRINLAEDRNRWRALVNAELNIRFP